MEIDCTYGSTTRLQAVVNGRIPPSSRASLNGFLQAILCVMFQSCLSMSSFLSTLPDQAELPTF